MIEILPFDKGSIPLTYSSTLTDMTVMGDGLMDADLFLQTLPPATAVAPKLTAWN